MDESGLIKYEEFSNWKSQIVISNEDRMGLRRPSYAFTEQCVGGQSKSLVLGGYHNIFENKKPQINADKRRFVIAYPRSFAFICGFLDSYTKRLYTHAVGQISSQALLQSEKPITKQAATQLVQIPWGENITKYLRDCK